MNKTNWLIILLFVTVLFSISAKSGCVNPFSTSESGSSPRSTSGNLVSSFGTDGVITSNPSANFDSAYDVAVDSQYMYVVGTEQPDTGVRWRIEKRNLSNGAFDTGFGSGGVVTSTDSAYGITIDSTYMYVVGSGGLTGQIIEKRALSNGAFDTGFGTNGVVTSTFTYSLADIAIDSTYMYVVGASRIEKRNLSDGALVTGFSSGGFISKPSDDYPKGIAIDSNYMYVVGREGLGGEDYQWRIEKRNLSDGTLVSNFGSGGAITINLSSGDDEATSLAIDSIYMYVAGFDYLSGNGQQQWRIEKRNLSDGALVTNFGTGGVITINPSSGDDRATSIAIDSAYMYVAGFDNASGQHWRIEKRNLSDGVPVTNFGVGGKVISNPSILWSLAIDSSYIYAVGLGSSAWHIEKRLK
ncbi:MAG TPA: hypothetical protein VJC37_00285 [Planctomycetota bacterium]|nr:hypothetical protein [Planctomycetota bacterium]